VDRQGELTHESQLLRERHSSAGAGDWRTAAVGVALALSGWALGQVYSHSERLARLETSISHQNQLLERIELKVDGLNQ
jgi:hypothetical protein